MQDMQIQEVPADAIVAANNDRRHFNQDRLNELANSIDRFGLAQPPTLRPRGDGSYEIVAGERRIRAMRDVLGWTTIKAQVAPMGDETASAVMLLENTGREDLNPIEEANAFQQRINEWDWTVEETAKAAGVSTAHVAKRLKLLELAPDIQDTVRIGAFPPKYAVRITHLDNNRQRFLLHKWRDNPSMGVIRWRDLVRKATEQMGQERQGDFFQLVNALAEDAKSSTPWKGKNAITGVPAGESVPAIPVDKRDAMAAIFDRYIGELRREGHPEAADAVGNVYNYFVYKGWVTVTSDVAAPKLNPDAAPVMDSIHIRHL